MVVPKSGGCCCGPVKAAPKKTATKVTTKPTACKKATTNPSTKKTTSKKPSSVTSSNKDEALKKRLKKMLGKDGKPSCAAGKGNSDLNDQKIIEFQTNLTNGIQKFILNTAKTNKITSTPFKIIDSNAKTAKADAKTAKADAKSTSTENKKSTTTTKGVVKKAAQSITNKNDKSTKIQKKSGSTTNSKESKPETKSGKNTTSVKKDTTKTVKKVKSDVSTNVKSDNKPAKKVTQSAKKPPSAPNIKKPSAKTINTDTSTASKRKAQVLQSKAVPAKKSKTNAITKNGRKPTAKSRSGTRGGCGCMRSESSSSGACGCGCGTSTSDSEDSYEDESDESSYDDYTDSDDESDSDSSDDGGCNGGACGRPPKPMNGKGRGSGPSKGKDTSGSWETQSDSNDDQKYTKKAELTWNNEDLPTSTEARSKSNKSSWKCEDVCEDKSLKSKTERKTKSTSEAEMKIKQYEEEPIKTKTERKTKSKSEVLMSKKSAEKVQMNTSKLIAVENKKEKPLTLSKNPKPQVERTFDAADKTLQADKREENSKTDKKKMKSDRNVKVAQKTQSKEPKNEIQISQKKLHKILNRAQLYDEERDEAGDTPKSKSKSQKSQSLVPYTQNREVSSDDENVSDEMGLETWDGNFETSSSDYTYSEEEVEEESYFSDSDSGEEYEYDSSDDDEENHTGTSLSEESDDSSISDYNSSADADYQLPHNVEEDILIRRGEAKIYDATADVGFNSDDSSPQIFEVSNAEYKNDDSTVTLDYRTENDDSTFVNESLDKSCDQESVKSNDSCPNLVPIDYINDGDEGDDFLEYRADSEFESSDTSEDESEGPPNYEPEIIKASDADIDEISTLNKIGLKRPVFRSKTFSQNNFASPLEILTHSTADHTKFNVVTIEDTISNQTSSKKRKSRNEQKIIESTPKISKSKRSSKPDIEDDVPLVNQVEADNANTSTNTFSKFYNSLNTYQVLLMLKKPVNFHGTLKIKLISGSINILGYNFAVGETKEVFSPRGSNLLCMSPIPSIDNTKSFEKDDFIKTLSAFEKDFMQANINEIIKEYDASVDAIVLLERNDHSKKIDMLRKYMKENVFPRFNAERGSPYFNSEHILRSRFYTECFNSFQSNPQWDSLQINKSTKLMVIGGKGVGKSTFLRYVINSNLRKFKQFLFIDLDIGQPEIFAPQTVSATVVNKPLLGPGYFYNFVPVKSFLYGDINVVLSPITYLTCVKELVKYCIRDNRFTNIPWVVNTMGYNKGFGAELLSVIMEQLQPTDVIQLQSPKQYNNFDYAMTPEVVRTIPRNIYIDEPKQDIFDYKFIRFESSVPPSQKAEVSQKWLMAPKEVRLTMMLAMMGNILSEKEAWLTDVKPYRVLLDDLNIICIDEENLSKVELLDVVNASLVYLCDDSKPARECFGIAVVRGIDKFNRTLYILPSVPPKTLAQVNTIAVCNIPLPAAILLNQGPKIKGSVPYTYNTDDLITSKHVPDTVYRPQKYIQAARNILLNE